MSESTIERASSPFFAYVVETGDTGETAAVSPWAWACAMSAMLGLVDWTVVSRPLVKARRFEVVEMIAKGQRKREADSERGWWVVVERLAVDS